MEHLLAIYMTENGPIEIGRDSSDADLNLAQFCAYRDIAFGGYSASLGFKMLEMIALARAEKPLMFKSVRAA